MPGWTLYDQQNGFYIYENQHYIPMGFTYEGYITRSELDELPERNRQLALLKALVVEDAQEGTVAVTLPHLDTGRMVFTQGAYAEDCAARADGAAKSFVTDKKGFSATIDLEVGNLVFFSVPYEEGWSATVNGQPAEIIRSNVGFMAVKCPADMDVNIRFEYTTPGLFVGGCISCFTLLLLAIYWLVCGLRQRKRPTPEVTVPLLPPARTPEPGGFDLYAIYRPKKD